jgi:predicted lipoprotein with Yx(FWY)xxD motif/plastocyanin
MNTRLTPAGTGSRVAYFGAIILALALAGCAASAPMPAATQAPPAPTAVPAPTEVPATAAPVAGATMAAGVTLVKDDQLGSFLADDKGMTLYLYTKDTPNTSNCYDSCAQAWPPLLTQGAPTAGTGVDASLLGTTTRTDGSSQVTYNGWPLYYFAKDQKAGDVTGQNVGKVWFVVSAKGDMVEAAAGASGSGTPTATPAASGSSGQAAGNNTVKVNAQNFAFDPKGLTITAGTTVVWHNSDTIAHTVTSDTGLFDSPLPPGADFQFTFSQAGTYPYYCRPHGGPGGVGMSGVITVQ